MFILVIIVYYYCCSASDSRVRAYKYSSSMFQVKLCDNNCNNKLHVIPFLYVAVLSSSDDGMLKYSSNYGSFPLILKIDHFEHARFRKPQPPQETSVTSVWPSHHHYIQSRAADFRLPCYAWTSTLQFTQSTMSARSFFAFLVLTLALVFTSCGAFAPTPAFKTANACGMSN